MMQKPTIKVNNKRRKRAATTEMLPVSPPEVAYHDEKQLWEQVRYTDQIKQELNGCEILLERFGTVTNHTDPWFNQSPVETTNNLSDGSSPDNSLLHAGLSNFIAGHFSPLHLNASSPEQRVPPDGIPLSFKPIHQQGMQYV